MLKYLNVLLSSAIFICTLQLSTASVSAKIELTSTTPPNEVQIEDAFTLDVTVSGADPNAEYYVRGVFYKPDSTQYFGFTQNNQGNWHMESSIPTQFFKMTGNETRSITFKADPNSPHFTPNSNYLFKIGRYTPAGSLSWSEQAPAIITLKSPPVSPTPAPSPPLQQLTPTPTISPSITPLPSPITSISLSEVMACPSDGQPEWVELINISENSIELKNWKIKDSTDTHSVEVNGIVSPHSYLTIQFPSSILNNSGDQVRLFSDQNLLMNQMSYPQCLSGTSFISVNGAWQSTQSVTPGNTNILTAPPVASPTITPSTKSQPQENDSNTHLDQGLENNEEPSSMYDPSLDTFFKNIPIASLSAARKTDNSTHSLPEGSIETSLTTPSAKSSRLNISTPISFLLAGCSYVLSAAMFAQKWYNLTSGI